MQIKTFGGIKSDIQTVMIESGTPAQAFRKISLVNALVTAVSAALAMGWSGLAEFQRLFFVSSAVGTDLDKRISDVGMRRNPGTFTTGSVIIRPSEGAAYTPGTLAKGVVFVSASGLMYELLEATDLLSPYTVAQVRAMRVGEASNLPSGSPLQFLTTKPYPVDVLVGTGYDEANLPVTDLGGGTNRESDESVRARYPEYLQSLSRCTFTAVKQALLQTPGVSNLVVQNKTPIPGWITISLASTGPTIPTSVETAIAATMDTWAAGGIGYILQPITQTTIPVSLRIYVNDEVTTTAKARTEVIAAVTALTAELQAGRSIYVDTDVKWAARGVTGVYKVEVLSPLADQIAGPSDLLAIGNVTVQVVVE